MTTPDQDPPSPELLIAAREVIAQLGSAGLALSITVQMSQDTESLRGFTETLASEPVLGALSNFVDLARGPAATSTLQVPDSQTWLTYLDRQRGMNEEQWERMRAAGLEATAESHPTSKGALSVTASLLNAKKRESFPKLGLNQLQIAAFIQKLIVDSRATTSYLLQERLRRSAAEAFLFIDGYENDAIAVVAKRTSGHAAQVERSAFVRKLQSQYPDGVHEVRRIFATHLRPSQQAPYQRKFLDTFGL